MHERRSRRAWVSVVVLAWLCAWTTSDARASIVVPLSLTELVSAADVIVDGTVEEVRHVEVSGRIERIVRVRVASAWKGAPDAVVYVRLAGGRIGRTEARVPGVPDVAAGDRAVWCLAPHPRGGYSVIGLHQGAMPTTMGPDGVARVLAPSTSADARGAVSRVPRPMTDLARDVRALAAGAAR